MRSQWTTHRWRTAARLQRSTSWLVRGTLGRQWRESARTPRQNSSATEPLAEPPVLDTPTLYSQHHHSATCLSANTDRESDNNNNTPLTDIFQENLDNSERECHHSGFYWSDGDGGGGDNWSHKTCQSPVKSLPSTNSQFFRGRISCLSPKQHCPSTEGRKCHISRICSPQAHLGSFILFYDHQLNAPGHFGDRLSSLLSAL